MIRLWYWQTATQFLRWLHEKTGPWTETAHKKAIRANLDLLNRKR